MRPHLLTQYPALLMLRAAWQWRRSDGRRWALQLYGVVGLLIYGVPAVAALVWLPPPAAAAVAGLLVLAGLASVWGVHFFVLLRLDHPHALHTVPGHRQALHSAALGLWAVLVLLAGVLAGMGAAVLGLADVADAVDVAAVARIGLAAALGTGALLLLVAAGLRWWWMWVLASVLPWMLAVNVWPRGGSQAWATLQPLWQAWALGSTLLMLAAMGGLLTGLFGRGGPGHAQAYRRREQLRQAAASYPSSPRNAWAAYGRWGAWLGWPGQALADAWLRRCLARPASAMARAEIVLHDSQHWVRHLAFLLLLQMVVGLCLLITASLTGAGLGVLIEHGRVGITVGLGFVASSAVTVLPKALWRSRREQALLVLLPGMPRGVALNRALAWRQWRHGLVLWLGVLPALVALVSAGHGLHVLAWVGVALPLSAWLWRDHARMPQVAPASGMLPAAAYVTLGLLSMWLLTRHPAALGPWLGGLLVVSAALLGWRWRVLQHVPPALPVGRLAG